MRRIWLMFCETQHLIRAHRLYFIAPILLVLVLLAFFALYLGPSAVLTFIYAGL
jgi:hypothetical protein